MSDEKVNPWRAFALWQAGSFLAAASACVDVWVLLLVSGIVHGSALRFGAIHAVGIAGTVLLVCGLAWGRKYFRYRSPRTAAFSAGLFLLGAGLSLLRMVQGID